MRSPHSFVFFGINPQTYFLCSCFLAKYLWCVSVLDMRPPALMSVFLNLCSWAVEQMHEWEGVLGSEVTIWSSLTTLFSDLECVTGHNCTSVPARFATCVSRLCHTNMLVCVVLFTGYVIKGWVRALVEKIQNPAEMHPTGSDSFSVFPRMFPSGHCKNIQWLQTQNY